MILQLLILAFLLFAVPLLAGGIFADAGPAGTALPFRWIGGQFCLWAGFQMICVPFVLAERSFRYVSWLFSAYCLVLAVLGAVRSLLRWRKRRAEGETPELPAAAKKAGRHQILLWALFAAVLLFQLVQAVRMTYTDGDDAYYVAISTAIVDDGGMYSKLPYTGLSTGLDTRHGLAPFPVWVAYLAALSGMEPVAVAHLVLPAVLIAFAYGTFYLLGVQLFPQRDARLPLYMLFTGILVLFGDYSIYTAENFLIARSRQGKAALCSIVIPFIFYLLLLWLKRLEKQEKPPAYHYLLFFAANMASCLCSTLGGVIVCLLTGIVGLLGAVSFKRWGQLLPMALCCVPCIGYAVLYLFCN